MLVGCSGILLFAKDCKNIGHMQGFNGTACVNAFGKTLELCGCRQRK